MNTTFTQQIEAIRAAMDEFPMESEVYKTLNDAASTMASINFWEGKKSIVHIDWDETKKSLESGDDTIRKTLYEAYQRMKDLSSEIWKAKEEKARIEHIDRIRKVKPHSKIYFIGNTPKLVGKDGFKVKNLPNGYSQVVIDGQHWRIENTRLSDQPMSREELGQRKAEAAIGQLLDKSINR